MDTFPPHLSEVLTGKGTRAWETDEFKRAEVIWHHKYQGILGLHNFSGIDWGSKFIGIAKTHGLMHT